MWEQSAAYFIDTHSAVDAFVKNSGLGFAIPYLDNGEPHDYVPDFLIRLRGEGPLRELPGRGVVAPLRCVRVKPIASLRTVEIVGGDFDQGQLATALDLDPLNMAAADLYQSRFGDTPGIVYAAGVSHAERVAAAM